MKPPKTMMAAGGTRGEPPDVILHILLYSTLHLSEGRGVTARGNEVAVER